MMPGPSGVCAVNMARCRKQGIMTPDTGGVANRKQSS